MSCEFASEVFELNRLGCTPARSYALASATRSRLRKKQCNIELLELGHDGIMRRVG
jgi:hypothetical protein